MPVLSSFANRHPVWTFLVLAFAFTWFWWGLAILRGTAGSISPLLMIGSLGPAFAAIYLSRTGARPAEGGARRRHRRALVVALIVAGGVMLLRLATGGKMTLRGEPGLMSQGLGALDILLLVLAVYLVAVVLAAGRSRDPGIRARLSSLLQWRLPAWGWAFALFALPGIMLAGVALARLQGVDISTPPAFDHSWTAWVPLLVIAVLVTALYGGGLEEPGWRGFMLPELQKRFSPLSASLLIALAWSLWHLPLHVSGFYEGSVTSAMVLRTVRMIPMSILFTWLYNRSGGSLLLVVLLHAVNNNYRLLTPVSWWAMVPAIVVVIGLVVHDRMWRSVPVQQKKARVPFQ